MTPSKRLAITSTLLLAAALLAPATLPAQQSPTVEDGPLQAPTDVPRVHLIGNDTILRMHKSGLGDDVLIQAIKTQPGRYDVTADDLISLKSEGISDKVILTMQAYGNPQPKRAAGLQSRSNPTPNAPAFVPAPDAADPAPLAAGIDEIGVYYRDHQTHEWVELKTERVIFKSGGFIKSTVTHGIVGKDMNGHIDGQKSPLVLSPGDELLIYTPVGTNAEEYDFLQFREHSDNREFRVNTGGVFHSTSGSQRDDLEFTPKKIGPQMYTYTLPNDLPKGEFGVLPPGSSNQQGISGSGKIFTFSIREENHPPAAKK